MKKMTSLLAVLTLVFLMLSSCANTYRYARKITVESGEIPPAMKTEKFILVGVLHGKNGIDKSITKNFKFYTGDYILLTSQDFNKQKYDKNVFRYKIDFRLDQVRGVQPGSHVTVVVFQIYDRLEERMYSRKKGSSFLGKELKTYLLAIDAARMK